MTDYHPNKSERLAARRVAGLDRHDHPPVVVRPGDAAPALTGDRVACTSRPFAWAVDAWQAERLMRFLDADPKYAALCGKQKCYRARLTPKPWRVEERVCELWSGAEARIHPDLAEQVRFRDGFALAA